MTNRKYYSQRNNKTLSTFTIGGLRLVFLSIYQDFNAKQYFDEYLGKDCPDGLTPGKIGNNTEGYIFRKLRKDNLWPVHEKYDLYTTEDIFDLVEFLFDHISKPLEKDAFFHGYDNCGWHYKNFDQRTAQIEFIAEINQVLNDYKEGYELNITGEILSIGEPELKPMLDASVPLESPESVKTRMDLANKKFRKYGSTLEERAEAVRLLADCLEYIRPIIKNTLSSKDDSDLFNIANNFSIRHHNDKQQTNYDRTVWLSWMFNFYLATLHACLRLMNKKSDYTQELKK